MKLPNALFSDPLGVNRVLRIHVGYSRSRFWMLFGELAHGPGTRAQEGRRSRVRGAQVLVKLAGAPYAAFE